MNIQEIITLVENADDLQDVNSALTSLCDIILSKGTITNEQDLAKVARLRARINIELTA